MEAGIARGDFIEHANVHGNFYGTSKVPLPTNPKSQRIIQCPGAAESAPRHGAWLCCWTRRAAIQWGIGGRGFDRFARGAARVAPPELQGAGASASAGGTYSPELPRRHSRTHALSRARMCARRGAGRGRSGGGGRVCVGGEGARRRRWRAWPRRARSASSTSTCKAPPPPPPPPRRKQPKLPARPHQTNILFKTDRDKSTFSRQIETKVLLKDKSRQKYF